jgi:hypothetical protein
LCRWTRHCCATQRNLARCEYVHACSSGAQRTHPCMLPPHVDVAMQMPLLATIEFTKVASFGQIWPNRFGYSTLLAPWHGRVNDPRRVCAARGSQCSHSTPRCPVLARRVRAARGRPMQQPSDSQPVCNTLALPTVLDGDQRVWAARGIACSLLVCNTLAEVLRAHCSSATHWQEVLRAHCSSAIHVGLV